MNIHLDTNENRFYSSIRVNQYGESEQLNILQQELQSLDPDEVIKHVRAVPVFSLDIQARYGKSSLVPRLPFISGYSVMGRSVDCDSSITQVKPCDRVAALTVTVAYQIIGKVIQEGQSW